MNTLERLAAVLYRSRFKSDPGPGWKDTPSGIYAPGEWDYEDHIEGVRAILAELREPSEEMQDVAQASLDCVPIIRCEQQSRQVWQNVIDAILEGEA